jgi:leucyl aminopeptidase (aminopeptidase T)
MPTSLLKGICLIQPTLTDLTKTSFDPELSPGAYNAVNTCLRIQPTEKVTVITDNECREIAASIAAELQKVGAPFKAFVLEDLAPRPLTDFPGEIAEDMETSDVSIFAVKVQRNELKSRMQMTDIVNRRKMRHAHMVNINKQIMLEGMRADYNKVEAISRKAMEIVANAKEVRCTNPAGSDFTAKLNPNYHWIKTSGIISRDKWGNLPGGEIFTTPGEVNGVCVVDGVVGDYLCEKYQDLKRQPLTIEMKNNRITKVWSDNKELEQEFWAYTHTDENSDLVGEFAIGTNIELTHVIGQILQDEKFPGIHIAFGNPYGEHTGANWYSATHIDVVGTQFNIWVDGRQIMEKGRFLIEA